MRYQFQSEYGQHSWKPRLVPDVLKILIGINIIMYLLKLISASQVDLAHLLGLSPGLIWPMVWQPITYLFMHGDFWHLAINMFVLWMFGSELEMMWGRKAFLKYYFITGIGSGLVWVLFSIGTPYSILIGASGAIYGILVAYGMMFPNRQVYLYFLIPIKVKWLVVILGAAAFISSWNSTSNISHLTHLSGMVIGYFYLKRNVHWDRISLLLRKKYIEAKSMKEDRKHHRRQATQQNLDKLLDKINLIGMDGLTDDEKEQLYSASRRISRYKEKD